MTLQRFGAACACLTVFLFTSAAFGSTAVSWTTLPQLFRQRYLERAPERLDPNAAAITERLGGFRFDPVVAAQWQRTRSDDGTGVQNLTTSITQGSPYGTELSVSHSQVKGDAPIKPNDATKIPGNTSLTLSQKLLKGGPLQGPAEGDAAALARELADLKTLQRFDELLMAAFTAFAGVEEADQVLTAARRAQAIAIEQSKSVADLVASGYKPKADLLISDQATLRAELQVIQATQRADQAHRALALSLFQEPSDEPLAAVVQAGDDSLEKRLEPLKGVRWNDDAPKLKEARLNLEAARLKERIARRDDWPSVDVSASIGRSTTRDDAGGPNKTTLDRSVGVSISIPLVSSIRRDNATLASMQTAKASSDAARIARELDDAHRALDEKKILAASELATAEKLAQLAAQALTIEQEKYGDGKSTIAEVRRVQEESDAAAQNVLKARKNLLVQYLEDARSAGVLGRLFP